jgi:hypothetical protein
LSNITAGRGAMPAEIVALVSSFTSSTEPGM